MKSCLGWKIDYTFPLGEPAFRTPDSMAWHVFKNPVVGAIGGVCAVLLEFADARIRTGVWEHSVFPADPIGRARRTGRCLFRDCLPEDNPAPRRDLLDKRRGLQGIQRFICP